MAPAPLSFKPRGGGGGWGVLYKNKASRPPLAELEVTEGSLARSNQAGCGLRYPSLLHFDGSCKMFWAKKGGCCEPGNEQILEGTS